MLLHVESSVASLLIMMATPADGDPIPRCCSMESLWQLQGTPEHKFNEPFPSITSNLPTFLKYSTQTIVDSTIEHLLIQCSNDHCCNTKHDSMQLLTSLPLITSPLQSLSISSPLYHIAQLLTLTWMNAK